MTFDHAVSLTQMLLGFAFAMQSIEHFRADGSERWLYLSRFVLALGLLFGVYIDIVLPLLFVVIILTLHRFQGPYNGGSDRMGILIVTCLCLTHFAPSGQWQAIAFGYLAIQLILSYFISGWVKIVNPEWRSGLALRDVFQFSAYPVSESLRNWQYSPQLLLIVSWAVIIFELIFPLALLSQTTLIIALVIAAMFHFSNACFFGLNRFFWTWISAYPSLLWFQERVF